MKHYSCADGLLRYKGRIWVGSDPELRLQLIHVVHSSALGGHSGIPVTYRRHKQLFAWMGMRAAVRELVSACQVYQQAKPDRSKLLGLLQPLPVPDKA